MLISDQNLGWRCNLVCFRSWLYAHLCPSTLRSYLDQEQNTHLSHLTCKAYLCLHLRRYSSVSNFLRNIFSLSTFYFSLGDDKRKDEQTYSCAMTDLAGQFLRFHYCSIDETECSSQILRNKQTNKTIIIGAYPSPRTSWFLFR